MVRIECALEIAQFPKRARPAQVRPDRQPLGKRGPRCPVEYANRFTVSAGRRQCPSHHLIDIGLPQRGHAPCLHVPFDRLQVRLGRRHVSQLNLGIGKIQPHHRDAGGVPFVIGHV